MSNRTSVKKFRKKGVSEKKKPKKGNKMTLKEFDKKCVSEGSEQKMCFEYLSIHPKIEAWRVNTGQAQYKNKDGSTRHVKFGKKAHPDITGYIKKSGISFFWEAKSEKGKLLKSATFEAQKQFIENVLRDGCLAGYGTCKDLIEYVKKINL